MAEADFGNQTLKAGATFDARARAAKIVIDHNNHLPRPAELEGTIDQGVLQPRQFLVTFDLLNR